MSDQTADAGADIPVEPEPTPTRYGAFVVASGSQDVLACDRDAYPAVVQAAREDGFWQCIDLTAVDYLGHPGRRLPPEVTPERFEVVINLLNHRNATRVRIRTQVPADEPRVASVFASYPGAENLEREVWDLFGITFEGHPHLTRILMPDEWEGHPLRKDYAVGRIPVQFKAASNER